MFVLFNGSVTQKFASGLAAAVLLSGASATLPGSQLASSSPESKDIESIEADIASPSPDGKVSDSPDVLISSGTTDPAEAARPGADLAPALSEHLSVHSHQIDGRQAATLYIKDIPVLTFVGAEAGSLANSSDPLSIAAGETVGTLQAVAAPLGDLLDAELENDPVLRATSLGSQLSTEVVSAADISVRWHEETEGYVVTLAGDDLLALDSRTRLPDTTDNPAEDALQVTNRLRRLLGGAEPVSDIEGRPEPEPVPEPVEVAPAETVAIVSSNVGSASWYGPGFHGRLSASGEVFNQNAMTAAHRTLPFGTQVRVTNLYNGAQVTVRINDRGPYSGGRIIDLSAAAADQIGLTHAGVGTVQLDVLGY